MTTIFLNINKSRQPNWKKNSKKPSNHFVKLKDRLNKASTTETFQWHIAFTKHFPLFLEKDCNYLTILLLRKVSSRVSKKTLNKISPIFKKTQSLQNIEDSLNEHNCPLSTWQKFLLNNFSMIQIIRLYLIVFIFFWQN